MMPALRRDPLAVFTEAAHRYGDVAYFAIGPRRGFLVSNPDDIRHVLQDNARSYHKSPLYSKLKTTLGNGLLTSEDDVWLRQRRMAQPAFHRQRLAALAAVMTDAAGDVAKRWEALAARGDVVDIADEMMVVTRTIVLRTLLGASLGPFAAQVDDAWAVANQHIGESFWSLGIAEQWPLPKYWRFRRARAVLDGAVRHIISERRRATHESHDLLSMLLAARDEDTGQAMTDEQVPDEVMTMLLAGQETTALALSWTWFLLSQHQDCRTRLEQEVDRTLDGRPPMYADLPHLPYARMVIDEALRLYPPAWGFSRQAMGPDEIGGYHLPRGWLVFLVPYVMHRHPAFWEEPERFDPAALHARTRRGAVEVRVLPVRCRSAPVHRQSLRAHGSAADRGDPGPAIPATTGVGDARGALAAHHAPASPRHADGDRSSRSAA